MESLDELADQSIARPPSIQKSQFGHIHREIWTCSKFTQSLIYISQLRAFHNFGVLSLNERIFESLRACTTKSMSDTSYLWFCHDLT